MSEKLYIGWAECDITPDLEKYMWPSTASITDAPPRGSTPV